jgi:Electron transfer DM13
MMKKSILLPLILLFVTVACTKHNTPTVPADDMVDSTAMVLYSGQFVNGPYGNVNGIARIYIQNGQYSLALENVSISNGPDLHVYLSKEILPANFIDLGRLQSVAGNQVYTITGNPDFSIYKYALIHCKQYNHLFGSAELR